VSERNSRHPIKNFFIKKSIQLRIISKIFFIVFSAGLLTLGLFIYFYNSKSATGRFYYMSNDVMQDLELQSILGVVLPPIIAVEIIAVCIAFGIGLVSSRKIAVPLYKIEKWAARIKNGNLKTKLAFREEYQFKELTTQCNAVTDFYRKTFNSINQHIEIIAQQPDNQESVTQNVQAIKQILEKIEL